MSAPAPRPGMRPRRDARLAGWSPARWWATTVACVVGTVVACGLIVWGMYHVRVAILHSGMPDWLKLMLLSG